MTLQIPDSWLREFLKTRATPKQIAQVLSFHSASVENIEEVKNDHIYTIEITTNRIDMASIIGIAREASATLRQENIPASFNPPKLRKVETPKRGSQPKIVNNPKLCRRVITVMFKKINIKPSPVFIQNRLESSGIRALNNCIDITNYIMLETGHPTHVFDYDRIKTGKLVIRQAKKGEEIVTLDGKRYLLTGGDTVIDDGTGRIIDLPGIMGTKNSVVLPQTKRVLFFIENNNPYQIRKTSMNLGIRTMAAIINEKGPDPELASLALHRGISLFQKITGGKLASSVIDIYPQPPKKKAITLSKSLVDAYLGVKLPKAKIKTILTALGFDIQEMEPHAQARGTKVSPRWGEHPVPENKPALNRTRSGLGFTHGQVRGSLGTGTNDTQLLITPPSWRVDDVTIPEDVIEEIARLYGYHNLPSNLPPLMSIPKMAEKGRFYWKRRAKNFLNHQGFNEVYSYSLLSKDLIKKSGFDNSKVLRLSNPLTSDSTHLRPTLISSLLTVVSSNQHRQSNLSLFELANVYLMPKNLTKLPDQRLKLCLVSTNDDLLAFKKIVDLLFSHFNITQARFKNEISSINPLRTLFVKDRSGEIYLGQKPFAIIGELGRQKGEEFGIELKVNIAEIDFDILAFHALKYKRFIHIPKYPPIIEDLTFTFKPHQSIGPVINTIKEASNLVKEVLLTDEYQNNFTFRITYQHRGKTLTGKEAEKLREKIISRVEKSFEARVKRD